MTMTLEEKYKLVIKIASCADDYRLTDEEVIKSFREEDLKALGISSINDIPNVYLKIEGEFFKFKNFIMSKGSPRFTYHFRYGTAPNPLDILMSELKHTREEAIAVLEGLYKQLFTTVDQKPPLDLPTDEEISRLR